jgi:hypothetical protein
VDVIPDKFNVVPVPIILVPEIPIVVPSKFTKGPEMDVLELLDKFIVFPIAFITPELLRFNDELVESDIADPIVFIVMPVATIEVEFIFRIVLPIFTLVPDTFRELLNVFILPKLDRLIFDELPSCIVFVFTIKELPMNNVCVEFILTKVPDKFIEVAAKLIILPFILFVVLVVFIVTALLFIILAPIEIIDPVIPKNAEFKEAVVESIVKLIGFILTFVVAMLVVNPETVRTSVTFIPRLRPDRVPFVTDILRILAVTESVFELDRFTVPPPMPVVPDIPILKLFPR